MSSGCKPVHPVWFGTDCRAPFLIVYLEGWRVYSGMPPLNNLLCSYQTPTGDLQVSYQDPNHDLPVTVTWKLLSCHEDWMAAENARTEEIRQWLAT